MDEERRKKFITHLHNVVITLEEKGYIISSIRYNSSCTQLEVTIDHPGMTGDRDYLQKAAIAAYGEPASETGQP